MLWRSSVGVIDGGSRAAGLVFNLFPQNAFPSSSKQRKAKSKGGVPQLNNFIYGRLWVKWDNFELSIIQFTENVVSKKSGYPPVIRVALGRATWFIVLCRKTKDLWHWVADGGDTDSCITWTSDLSTVRWTLNRVFIAEEKILYIVLILKIIY
ncbi:hypothetical protein IEQ34_018730 [Dendrobium chrysotoxum]|uniref:Uncharacterized protein n=1 Tax=Dendrobium chrysotoxum TaxID=161865 RepID=A0AAV7G5F6_DENCH|nr:hypothetical protein IEQ34_018730 [Dendrobium chrysotoxum]